MCQCTWSQLHVRVYMESAESAVHCKCTWSQLSQLYIASVHGVSYTCTAHACASFRAKSTKNKKSTF